MDEREELLGAGAARSFLGVALRYLLFLAGVVALAVYVGHLLFGTNSVEVLFELRVQQRSLERSIDYLKKENARLQKEYFELKELEAQE